MRRTALTAILTVPLALTALTALTACDDDPAPASSTTQPPAAGGTASPTPAAATTTAAAALKACALLPKKDAEALADSPLNAGIEGPEAAPSCMYTGPVSGPTAQVEIYVGDGAKKYYDIDRTLNHTFTPFTGAGEEAYAEDDAVFFRKATTWVAIRLVRLDDPALHRDPLQNLARQVAGRL